MSTSNDSLRIAYLTPEFVSEPKFDGGLANYLHRVSRALRDAGHQPEVFVLSDRDESFDFDGVRVHRVRQEVRSGWRSFRNGVHKMTGVSLVMTTLVREGARRLAQAFLKRHDEQRFDLVQGSDFYATALHVPRDCGVPIVTRLSWYAPLWREAYDRPLTWDGRSMEWLESRVLRRSHFRYGPSSQIARHVAQTLGIRIEVIHPPAFLDVDGAQEDASVADEWIGERPFVLFVGRVCRLKGVYTLAKAMRSVLSQHPELSLVFVGREDPASVVSELRADMGDVAARLIHIPRTPHHQLYPIIRRAACVALPSRIDNFPNTCLEAMALGQVVIGTQGTGFDDLLTEGESGFLIPRDDADALSTKIEHVLRMTPGDRDSMRAAALTRVQDFAPERTVPQLIDYYRNCIAARSHRSRPERQAV